MSTDRLNPKIDFVFRKLFGSEENKDLLISLINSVLGNNAAESHSPIVDVTLKNPFNLASYPGDKESILDIKAVDQEGTQYDIEMQVESHSLYGRRAVYYLAKTYTDQLDSGEDYSHLNTVIGIHFLDFVYFADDRVIRQFVFKDVETNDAPQELGGVRLYFIEMPKFDKGWPEVVTALDRWVAFLNRVGLDQEALPEELTQDAAVLRAARQLERAGFSPREREIYEGEVKKKMVDAVQLRDAEQRGIQIGTEQGQRRLLLKQMARRLGEVPPVIASRLESLHADVLEDLGVSLPDLHTYADVEQWLTRN